MTSNGMQGYRFREMQAVISYSASISASISSHFIPEPEKNRAAPTTDNDGKEPQATIRFLQVRANKQTEQY
jgi:hypothetical protein